MKLIILLCDFRGTLLKVNYTLRDKNEWWFCGATVNHPDFQYKFISNSYFLQKDCPLLFFLQLFRSKFSHFIPHD